MDLLKKHYEKVLLGAVLVGLAVAVAFLPFKISAEKQRLEDLRITLTHPIVKPLSNLDLSLPESALQRVSAPVRVDFSAPERLFNPMPWQKTAEGQLIPLDDSHIGPRAVTISKITPLYLHISLDSVFTAESDIKYVIGVQNEAATNPRERVRRTIYCPVGYKDDTFSLINVQGAANNPTNVVLQLDDGALANISTNRSFSRIAGYMADLDYAPEGTHWRDQRVDDVITLNGEKYTVVAVNKNEVVLSAKSNQKKWTIKRNPAQS